MTPAFTSTTSRATRGKVLSQADLDRLAGAGARYRIGDGDAVKYRPSSGRTIRRVLSREASGHDEPARYTEERRRIRQPTERVATVETARKRPHGQSWTRHRGRGWSDRFRVHQSARARASGGSGDGGGKFDSFDVARAPSAEVGAFVARHDRVYGRPSRIATAVFDLIRTRAARSTFQRLRCYSHNKQPRHSRISGGRDHRGHSASRACARDMSVTINGSASARRVQGRPRPCGGAAVGTTKHTPHDQGRCTSSVLGAPRLAKMSRNRHALRLKSMNNS